MPGHVDPPPPHDGGDGGDPGCLPLPHLRTAWERLREAGTALVNTILRRPRTRPVQPSATYLVLQERVNWSYSR